MKTITIYIIFFVAFVGIVLLFSAGCGSLASESKARNHLANQGFKNIEYVKRDVFFVTLRGCSDSDTTLFTYHATNPSGNNVTVQVCEGFPFKGATIRG